MPSSRRGFLGLGLSSLALGACAGEKLTLEPGTCPEPEEGGGLVEAPVEPPDEADDRFAELRGFCDGIAPVAADELTGRGARLADRLAAGAGDVFITEGGASLEYLAGTRWGRSERPLILLQFADASRVFVGPAFETGKLRERLGDDAELRTWQEHESPYALVASVLRERRAASGQLLVDPETRHFVVAGLTEAVPRARIRGGDETIAAVRMHKSPVELTRLRRANEATKASLRVCAGLIEPGMTESEARLLITQAQHAAGLEEVWALVLFGPNAAFPHGTGRERTLGSGDLILVDTGGGLHGYRSDITRTWPAGEVTAAQREAYAAVLSAQTAALEQMRPGRRAADVDAAARQVIADAGFGDAYQAFTHRLGHGIGLQVHEAPYMVRDNPLILEAGMTMSNEPGIYVPGELGVRIEDIVAITEDGHEVFGPRAAGIDAPFGP